MNWFLYAGSGILSQVCKFGTMIAMLSIPNNESDQKMEPLSNVLQSLKMLDDNTVEVLYRENARVNLEEIKTLMDKMYEFTENKRLKRLIVITKNATMDMKARHFLQEENMSRKNTIIAEAVVVTSLTQKMTTNFYLKFIKDLYPCRFFTDVEKAREWLSAYE